MKKHLPSAINRARRGGGKRRWMALLAGLVTLSLSSWSQAKTFVHPGLLHTASDFTRMAAQVAAKANPWYQGYEMLNNNSHAQTSWTPRPVADVDRGGSINNYGQFYGDVAAAYQLALQWKVTGNTAYANQSIYIMNQWSSTLTEVTGDADRFLAAGIYGYEFANAGEIMRTYSGWAATDFARFQNMMLTIFYPMNNDFLVNHNGACITNYWANWDLCNIASMAAIGVLCDNTTVYNQALTYFKTGGGNGQIDMSIPFTYSGSPVLGQGQEEGRDQGHSGLDVSLWGVVCQQFYNQGDDMFAWETNKVLSACEYLADYNINTTNTVPFTTYSWQNGTGCSWNTQTVISSSSRGDTRPAWELIYSHYVGLRGVSAPYSTAYAAVVRPEGGGGDYGSNSGGYDQLGFGTLTYTLTAGSPIASGYYLLQNRTDSNMLDSYGLTANSSPAYQYAKSGSANQTWYFQQISGSTYTITSQTGLLLDSLGHTGNGSTVGQYASSGSNNQKWTITSLGSGYYKITNVANGLCLDTGGLTANGSVMQMWGTGSSTNQQWSLHAP
ncbi:MAG: RICIN domain-containing protein [Chthoniobacteraceae bacterium]